MKRRSFISLGSLVAILGLLGLLACASAPKAIAAEKQPHMRLALVRLHEARAQLQRASRDKGGHRAKALAMVNDAIEEVERGIRYDVRH